MKKALALVYMLCLSMAMSAAAFAADIYTEGAFQYTIDNESVTIVGYFGNESDVTVPNMIAGYPVNTIASGAFLSESAKTIYLPDTITEIEGGAVKTGMTIVYNSNVPAKNEAPDKSVPTSNTGSAVSAGTATDVPNDSEISSEVVASTQGKDATDESQSTDLQKKVAAEGIPDDERTGASLDTQIGLVVEEDGTLEESEVVMTASENAQDEATIETKGKTFKWAFLTAGIVAVLGVVAMVYKKRREQSGKL